MQIELDQIILGDCLDIMPSIPDKSIDAIICDPPYAVLNKSNASAKWDNIIPFESPGSGCSRPCTAWITAFGACESVEPAPASPRMRS